MVCYTFNDTWRLVCPCTAQNQYAMRRENQGYNKPTLNKPVKRLVASRTGLMSPTSPAYKRGWFYVAPSTNPSTDRLGPGSGARSAEPLNSAGFRMLNFFGHCLIGILLLVAVNVQATMRCKQDVIDEGALTVDVLRKCGQPDSREVFSPAVDQNGHIRDGAVTVEIWVYGPENGMYRYLRFIEGQLVKIWSKPG